MNAEKTGKVIAELRKEKNLKQSELADMIMVSDKAISRWETGRGFPDINNLEALSEKLDITVAELLKGERIEAPISKDDLMEVSNESLLLTKEIVRRKRLSNILVGFLLSLMVLSVAVIHLVSPIYIKDAGEAIRIEELNDGSLIGLLSEKASGVEVGTIEDPDTKLPVTFVSCYETRLDRILGKKNAEAVMLGNASEAGNVYYYPSKGTEDLLIYGDASKASFGGIATLPRLIYNYWLVIAIALTVVGGIAYFLLRKKPGAVKILKAATVPAALSISIILCLFGRFDEIYNAGFYLSGIILLTLIITAASWIVINGKNLTEHKVQL